MNKRITALVCGLTMVAAVLMPSAALANTDPRPTAPTAGPIVSSPLPPASNDHGLDQLKFKFIPNPQPEIITLFAAGISTRVGVAIPSVQLSYRGVGVATLNPIIVFNGQRTNIVYEGLSISIPVMKFGASGSLMLTGGWSATFEQLFKPKNGSWGLGLAASYKF